MRQRAHSASRSLSPAAAGRSERANYNKMGYLPYISNPALVGFNCSLWSSLPLGLGSDIIKGEKMGKSWALGRLTQSVIYV